MEKPTRRHVIGLVVALALLVAVVPITANIIQDPDVTAGKAAGTPRVHLLALTNAARARSSAGQLQLSHIANATARQHAVRMSLNNRLYHSCCLTHDLRDVTWFVWGENVGVGTNVFGLFTAFMASQYHRANMLDTRFTHVGIGFYRHGHILWVTMIFFG